MKLTHLIMTLVLLLCLAGVAGAGELRDLSLRIFDRTFAVTYAHEAVA